MRPRFGPADACREAATFDERGEPSSHETSTWLRRLRLGETFQELQASIRDADLLISSSLQGLAPWVHEATGIPWINATIFPMEFQAPRSEPEPAGWRALLNHRNDVRRELGLPPLADERWRDYYWSDRRILVATSTYFCQPLIQDHPQARITGFWFDEPVGDDWMPDPALANFLADGPAPLVPTLSSLPVQDPVRIVTLHAEAAARLGVRLVIQQGWAGLSRDALAASPIIRPEAILFCRARPTRLALPAMCRGDSSRWDRDDCPGSAVWLSRAR